MHWSVLSDIFVTMGLMGLGSCLPTVWTRKIVIPPRCQLIFKLVKEDGLKYREVAELLHLSTKTVENQMTIALKKIGQSVRIDLPKTSLN